jgi:hypothetical protein
MNIFKKIYKFFDKLEDRVRVRLSHRPFLYAFLGSLSVVLIWRGIWEIADKLSIPGWLSLFLGILIALVTGLFVSLFIGDKVIISGINKEKRIDEKTEDELKKEEAVLEDIKNELKEIKEDLSKIK